MNLQDGPVAIVGAGITGSVIARLLAEQNIGVDVYERRPHIGGNCFDVFEYSSYTHSYGPHLFHTSDKRIVDFLARFTDFRPCFHKVKAYIDGELLPIPFSLATLLQTHPALLANRLTEKLIDNYGYGNQATIYQLLQAEDQDLNELGSYVYQKIFLGYSQKQWGLDDPMQLDKGVLNRIPVRVNMDTNYFADKYQMMPALGYTSVFKHMLDHPNIQIRLNQEIDLRAANITPGSEQIVIDGTSYRHVFYSGMIDRFFDYQFGQLDYRSLYFDFTLQNTNWSHRPTMITNYPSHFNYTRIADYSHLSSVLGLAVSDQSRVCYEYPGAYDPLSNQFSEPYYPLFTREARSLHALYEKRLGEFQACLTICGRLGDYKYYDMDDAITAAISTATTYIKTIKQ
jgi:UDP-galactopyranose mutase